MTIAQWLSRAARELLSHNIHTARLDSEIILAHTLRRSRTWLHAHGDEPLDRRRQDIGDARVSLRCDNTPIAYIIGHKEFYGRTFKVTPDTLIPRPESEEIIEQLGIVLSKQLTPLVPESNIRLVDIGTGSGCLGITAKLEWPAIEVTLIDKSKAALTVAKENASRLKADLVALHGDLLYGNPAPFNIVVANLPYVDKEWDVSPDTRYEPDMALYANDKGLELIYTLISQLPRHLTRGGVAILEADPRQHSAIITAGEKHGLKHITTSGFIVQLRQN